MSGLGDDGETLVEELAVSTSRVSTPLEESDESGNVTVWSRSITVTLYGVKPGDGEIIWLWVDEDSTYGEIQEELVAAYRNYSIVVLQAFYNSKPYWKECTFDQTIESTCRNLYAIAIEETKRYTLGVVQTASSDYPVAIFDSINEPVVTVFQAISTSQPGLVDQIRQVVYERSDQDITRSNYEYGKLQDEECITFPTVFYIVTDDTPGSFITSFPHESVPPFLQVSFVHCENLLQRAYNLTILPLQTIFVTRACLHLIIALSIAVAPVQDKKDPLPKADTANEDLTSLIRVAPFLAEEINFCLRSGWRGPRFFRVVTEFGKTSGRANLNANCCNSVLHCIQIRIDVLEGNPIDKEGDSWDIDLIFLTLCGDYPGAVTIRRSHSEFESLKARDAEDAQSNLALAESGSLDIDDYPVSLAKSLLADSSLRAQSSQYKTAGRTTQHVAYRRTIERLKEGGAKRKIQAVQVETERKQA